MLGRNSGNHDWLLANASACVSCGFRLRNARNASTIAFEWKPGLTVGVDFYDTGCDRVSYDPLTHSRHNGEV